MREKREKQRGAALILNALMLSGTIAMIGLAVDVGTMFMVKARLNAAVDSAALAAGRAVNLANTEDEARDNAEATAQQFMAANFPTHYMGTIGTPTATAEFIRQRDGFGNVNGILDIQIDAVANAPTYFMKIFHIDSVPVRASGTASRRGLVMVLVLDKSSSMNTGAPTACSVMKQAAQKFIKYFSPFDYIGLVSFNATAYLDYVPSTSYGNGSLNTAIGNINCGSNTNTTAALELAYQQIRNINLPLAQNTIVLFTDGSPNGVNADFPLRTDVDTRWGPAINPPAPPAQAGSTYGIPNSCTNGAGNGAICVNMPSTCGAGGTVTGTLTQVSGQNAYGGAIGGLYKSWGSDPAIVYPGCTGPMSNNNLRQLIAYIPDTDRWGNSTHGVVATGPGPTVSGGLVTRDLWLFQTNNACSPDPLVVPACKFIGNFWSTAPAVGSASNFYPAGPYTGKLRNDQPNTICVASANTAMAEGYRIRDDTTYNIVINSIYLTGNMGDAVDREFLPVISNVTDIPRLPYEPFATAPYANPAHQPDQQHGKYLVTANVNELEGLFAQLASEVLRLSR